MVCPHLNLRAGMCSIGKTVPPNGFPCHLVIPVASAYLMLSNKPEKGVGGVGGYQARFI